MDLKRVKKIFKHAKELAEIAGYDGAEAVKAADILTFRLTGYSPLDMLIKQPLSAYIDVNMLAGQLKCGDGDIHKALQAIGYQEMDVNGLWKPTELGLPFCRWEGSELLWEKGVINALQALFELSDHMDPPDEEFEDDDDEIVPPN